MKKYAKWALIIIGGLTALVILALLLAPMFIDIQEYKPLIEKKVTEATGRPFKLAGDLQLSFFPWAGMSFSELHLGNPSGYETADMLAIQSFEVRVKLLPLFSKDIQVKRFVLKGFQIALEKNKEGRGNWEGLGQPAEKLPYESEKKTAPAQKPMETLPIKSMHIGEFSIQGGKLLWIDHTKGERREITDFTLNLMDVSLERPIQLAFSAAVDGRNLSLKGTVGPLGRQPGKEPLPFDLTLSTLEQLNVNLKGVIKDAANLRQFDIALAVAPFSPRKLMAALEKDFPLKTSDPEVLKNVALEAKIKGTPEDIAVSEGALVLDQSKLNFSARARDFSKPDVAFDLNLDQIDLDRYLPPPSKEKPAEKKEPVEKTPPDYTPLRKLVVDGTVRAGKLKMQGARLTDIYLKIKGKNGQFQLKPLTVNLYEGGLSAAGNVDVRKDAPRSKLDLRTQGIQINPLLNDLLQKDFLEGTLQSQMAISLAGDTAEQIKKTLNGKGKLLFKDGAIRGIDLSSMLQNLKAGFGMAGKGESQPRTDFAEFSLPFTAKNGVFNTTNTSLTSPLLRVLTAGKVDLVKDSLDLRVEPKFVGTLKGQGDSGDRTGITVPVLVKGSLSDPKFSPDMKGMLQQTLKGGVPEPSEMKKIFEGQGTKEDSSESSEKGLPGIMKKLPF
ncbi:AsmA family protein [Thermodesulfobacteriota bacterium]